MTRAQTAEQKAAAAWLKKQTGKMTDAHELEVDEAIAVTVAVERWLQSHQVEYAPATDIPMSMIDVRKSRSNQARKDPIVPESVERFTLAMKAGAVFPPIVVYPYGGKLVIIDGNNRHESALRAKLDTIRGIVIADTTPGELIQLLTVQANATHGVTPDLSWRLRQAFHLVSMGFTDQIAADVCSVTVNQIQHARRVQEADARALKLKIMGFGDLSATTRGNLGTLKDDAVFSRASLLAISSGMTIDEVRDMNRELKKYSSEKSRLDFIESLHADRGIASSQRKALGSTARHAPRQQSAKALLVSGSGMILRADEQTLVKSIVTKHDYDQVQARLKALEEKILAMYVALETVQIESDEE